MILDQVGKMRPLCGALNREFMIHDSVIHIYSDIYYHYLVISTGSGYEVFFDPRKAGRNVQ